MARRPYLAPPARAALAKPAKVKPTHAADLNTYRQIARAVGFRACIFKGQRGPGVPPYDATPFDTLTEARAFIEGKPRSVIYAISPEGYTIHVPSDYEASDA